MIIGKPHGQITQKYKPFNSPGETHTLLLLGRPHSAETTQSSLGSRLLTAPVSSLSSTSNIGAWMNIHFLKLLLRGLFHQVKHFATMCPRQSILQGVSKQGLSKQGLPVPRLVIWEVNICKCAVLPRLEVPGSEQIASMCRVVLQPADMFSTKKQMQH